MAILAANYDLVLGDQKHLRPLYVVTIGALLFLLVITAINQNPPLFDEILFVRNMPLYKEHGLSEKFLLEMYDQAPGPLYQIVQTFFEPLTHLEVPGIRLVNVFLFFLIIVNIYLTFRQLGNNNQPWLLALNIVGVPVVWQVAGMALTEIPAMFFATLSIALAAWLYKHPGQKGITRYAVAVFAGLMLGMAIIGRTPFLMILPALGLLFINPIAEKGQRMPLHLSLYIIIAIVALAICAPIFYVWKGLLPPHQQVISKGGISWWHGVLAFAYAGIIVMLLTPGWYTITKRTLLILGGAYIAFVLLDMTVTHVEYWPMSDFLSRFLPAAFMEFYPHLISPVLMVIALYFVSTLLMHVWRNRNDAFYVMLAAALALALATCANITHLFSSRYVAQAAPLLILLTASHEDFKRYKLVRLGLGIVMGYISLQTYVSP